MKKKIVRLLGISMLAVATVFSACACGSDADTETESAKTSEAASEETEETVAEDTRVWTIAGSFQDATLSAFSWDNSATDAAVTLTATGNQTNEFAITVDLYAGDQFQVLHDNSWDDQRGYGWFTGLDETCFECGDTYGDETTANINVIKDGNYTITIVTNPKRSAKDVFTITCNGDVVGSAAAASDDTATSDDTTATASDVKWTIVGSFSDASLASYSWDNTATDAAVAFTQQADGSYTITVALTEGDEFQIIHDNSWDDQRGYGRISNIDETKFENAGGLGGSDETSNIKVLVTGTYTITVSADETTVTIE